MKTPKINSTTDHTQFKKILSNRQILPNHVKRLAKDIERRNLLHLFPIIVNSRMEIIEGQHRHAAARDINVPLYFIIDDDIKRSDIAAINSLRKSWTGKDYVNHYAGEGVKEFKKLKELLDSYPKMSIMAGARLMDQRADSYFFGGTTLADLRAGICQDKHYPLALQIASFAFKINQKRTYSFFPNFLLALKNTVLQGEQDIDKTLNKIESKLHILPKMIDRNEGMVRELKDLTLIP